MAEPAAPEPVVAARPWPPAGLVPPLVFALAIGGLSLAALGAFLVFAWKLERGGAATERP